jgi:hypothetical protein
MLISFPAKNTRQRPAVTLSTIRVGIGGSVTSSPIGMAAATTATSIVAPKIQDRPKGSNGTECRAQAMGTQANQSSQPTCIPPPFQKTDGGSDVIPLTLPDQWRTNEMQILRQAIPSE